MESPPSAATSVRNPNGDRKFLGLFQNARKHKQSFIQFFAMTGILLLSCRSLGQKYRIHGLTEDNVALKEEQERLMARMDHIKQGLQAEAALEPTGAFATRLRLLFGDDSN
ncbi:uncharacterized protein LOC127256833 [Andrographis paniculata]|uniref:uncharacterized protein LOC127256833 n=1 Tax=Andrographis paniculata TaxID=175694 RepID=UPI0021E8CEF3|nr:uncharacterized protein LOC127256833 [Andrographis paniculata]